MAACWWVIIILGSSPNGAGTGGVVVMAFLPRGECECVFADLVWEEKR